MDQVKDYLAKELSRLVAKLPPNRSRHVDDLAHWRHAEVRKMVSTECSTRLRKIEFSLDMNERRRNYRIIGCP
jgi:hypothetical protein